MKYIFSFYLFLTSLTSFAQDPIWKHEFKMKTGITEFNLIRYGSGIYFIERRDNVNTQPNSGGVRRSYINVSKMDTAFKEVWSREYFLALAEYDIIDVVPANGYMVIFLGRYDKKNKAYTIDLAPIDDAKGNIPKESQFVRVATYPRGERREDYFNVTVTKVKQGFMLLSDLSSKKSVSHAVTLLSPDLKTIFNTIIDHASDPSLYAVKEVAFNQGKIVVLAKTFHEGFNPEGKKALRPGKYVMSVYNVTGQSEGEIVPGDMLVSTAKFTASGDSLLFAGLYNAFTIRETPDGIITGIIDPVNRTFNTVSDKKIAPGMFATAYRGDTDTSELYKRLPLLSLKNRRRYADSNSWIEMRSINVNPTDNSLMIGAEIIQLDEYDEYIYGNTSFGLMGAALPSGQVISIYEYKTRDLILFNADSRGNVNWINVIPKNQQETFMEKKPPTSRFSSYKAAFANDKYNIIYNDSKVNTLPVDYKDTVNVVWDFKKEAALYKLTIDPKTGAIVKNQITDASSEGAILMPSKTFTGAGSFTIPAREIRMFAKDVFKIAVISQKLNYSYSK